MAEPARSFESAVPFDARRVQAAAVYCSDGRWGEQVDDLLHNALGLPRYDRLAVPGGAACLAGHFATYREEEGVLAQLRFLVAVHRLEQLVLIAHEDCAFYTERLHVSPLQMESRQREDMQKAIRRVRGFGGHLQVLGFFARQRGGSIRFEPVEL
ncbi:MAG TPA: carbonic anhydrase [Planctomycetaceae bacterium]|nr:carbonic anhydrase [Planctomycetaceae bacterium]